MAAYCYSGVLLLCVFVYAYAQSPSSASSEQQYQSEEARLLASKFMLSNYAVETKDFVIDYHIYNVGEKAATKVQLDDDSYPTSQFEVVRGLLKTQWDRIPAGGNVSHTVVLRPKLFGYFNFTAARITYQPGDEPSVTREAHSTAIGESYIYRFKDFERKFSPRIMDWGCFALMTLPSLLMPFLLWRRSSSKYERLTAGSKKQT